MRRYTMNNIEIEFSKIDRKNIIIKKLSNIIYEMVTELGDIPELVAYSGNLDDMQTLLDCILDESADNEHSLSSILEHLGKQSDFNYNCIAEFIDNGMPLSKRINVSEILELEKRLNLPNMTLYRTISQMESEVNQ